MDLEPLPSILLALAERRLLDEVLSLIAETIARQPGIGMVRLWLRIPQDACPVCAGEKLHTEGLHLRASAGQSRTGADWSRIDGDFHWIEIARSNLKVVHIALKGESIRIPDLREDHGWIRYPEWARAEGLVSFVGHPLLFRGESLGTLAVFRRTPPDDNCLEWLRTMTHAAAVAIANARAFEENERLRLRLEEERDYLREEVEEVGRFGEILGRSPALERVLQQVRLVAQTDANVLILGESGTGKELLARAIHEHSRRSKRAMVKVNCGSIPRELFESEFFGHVRGSFTGAIRDREGRFQLADGGTLFLDEVGEIPLELQSKLLRVLQEGEFERVGEERTRRVNVRVVAATNRDLRKEIEAGHFRLDLYYRLGVFPMEVPPLRERREDIPDLITHFVKVASERFHLPRPVVPAREVERARSYDWPGNVRELQNAVERAVIVSNGGKLRFELPGSEPVAAVAAVAPLTNEIIPEGQWREMERRNIQRALTAAKGRISGNGGAAELLGLHPATLTSRMKVLGVSRRG